MSIVTKNEDMNTASFFETVESIFHDWNYGHPKVLYGLIRALKPMSVVEVGTYRGYAACYMARGLQENNAGKLYCIDDLSIIDHASRYGDPVKHWESNLEKCGVRDFATLILGKSSEVKWPSQVDFAYIDGWHSYLQAKNDFDLCEKYGAQCICLDDTLNCIGPRKLIGELDRTKWSVVTIGNDNGLSICHKIINRKVTFSQEFPDNPGVDITNFTKEQISAHLKQSTKITNVTYENT